MSTYLEHIRSLGFGGMLGAGILGLIYCLAPEIFASLIQFQNVLIVGAFLGAGLHGLIDQVIVKPFLGPFASHTAYYSKLVQILVLGRLGIIDQSRCEQLIAELTEQQFLLPPPAASRLPVLTAKAGKDNGERD